MNIKIFNCNNIDSGSIDLVEGRLNIKYAINETGKSTLAKAIEYRTKDELKNLIPYRYLTESPILAEHQPSVNCSCEIQNVAIFNEEYVNQYLFLPNELLANSFEIFVKTADYENRMKQIQLLIHDVQKTFRENPDLDKFITDLTTFISGFGNAQNGYSKTGSIGKGLAKGNKILNVPSELIEYTTYIQCEMNASWLTWQNKGNSYLDLAEKCPYCANKLKDEQKLVVQKVAEEYDSKYVAELQKMMSVFQSLSSYFTDSVKETITRLSTSCVAFNQEEINFLKEIKSQVNILNNKLIAIKHLNFSTLKDVGAVIVALQDKIIDLNMFGHINSDFTNEKIKVVNTSLESVIAQASRLQGEINQQNILIKRTIEKYHNEINGFLESAGYNYKVSIIEDTDKDTYRMVLLSKENLLQVDDVKLHLSYGERNAFALVLFMYRTIKEKSRFNYIR